jgi:predicted MFS family arabinose efflux permease
VALIGAGPTIIALGLSEWLVPDLLILFLLGAFGEAMWVAAQQSIALDVPRHISGSILGLFFATMALATVVGSLLFGLLFDLVGVRFGLVMLGAATSANGLLQIWLIARSNKDQSAPSPSQPSSQ